MALPDFEAWAIFARVVEHRSFSGAAEAIGISKATVSKAIGRLEQRLGVSLFHRTSRRLTLTDSGRELAERAQRILDEGLCAEESARDSVTALSGLVRVAAPMHFGKLRVAPLIADFLEQHPDVSIELHLSDAKVDIVAEGFDVALRIANLPDSSLRARRLAGVRIHTVAAPAYLDRRGRPRHPADLSDHACFGYTNAPSPNVWTYRGRDGSEIAVRPDGPLRSNAGEGMIPSLLAGLGIARLPDFIVDTHLEQGALEAVLTEWSSPPVALHLMTPPGTLRPARVEALMDFLTAQLRSKG
ncbi:LysR family transcriptional regulator [Stakelama sediminis]|uniref:DNA-binding transcriptional LysR family regulator n=1 Tax=Stakelama sediminis TaxID=463200 RepID=A0A840YVM0_9SPHN|nr:LysR family transcriptional regulator [Stakelama sediminis]MBB5717584.1 DNA-binding transcriptional LysR family regulator [Stakelama sediminis]